MNTKKDKKIAFHIRKEYPATAEKYCQRARLYNKSVAIAKKYARQGRALIIAPDDTCGADTLTRNKAALQRLYEKGYRDAKKIPHFMQR